MRARLSPFAVALACVSVIACGEGGKSPMAPAAAQPFSQTITGTVPVFGTTQHAFTAPRAGTMTVRLAWGNTEDLDLYLSTGACANPFTGCMLGTAAGSANPEVITRAVAIGESFQVWVDSFSETQAVGYTVTISIN